MNTHKSLYELFSEISNIIRYNLEFNGKIRPIDFSTLILNMKKNRKDYRVKSFVDKSIKYLLVDALEGITKIGSHAFDTCTDLALTSLPESVTYIGSYAFYYCTNLALTSLPEGITSIGDYAFYNCRYLTSITFKGTPNSIGSNVFMNSFNLTTINVPWSEGEVTGAPWGATNATINYNYNWREPEIGPGDPD